MAKQPPKHPGDYEVGNKRPPKHTQFRPGQSGNPTGRKKGSVNLKTIVRRVAETEIALNDNGVQRRVSVLEGVVISVAKEAIRGKPRSARDFIDLCGQHLPGDESETAAGLAEEDEDILARFLTKKAKRDGADND